MNTAIVVVDDDPTLQSYRSGCELNFGLFEEAAVLSYGANVLRPAPLFQVVVSDIELCKVLPSCCTFEI